MGQTRPFHSLALWLASALLWPAWAGAQEQPKPVKMERWMVEGTLAALRDPDERIKIWALEELGRLRHVEFADSVAEYLSSNQPKPLRLAALRTYAALAVNNHKHLAQVEEFLTDPGASG